VKPPGAVGTPVRFLCREVKALNVDLAEQNLLSLSYGRIVRKDIDSNDGLLPASFERYTVVEPGDSVLRLTDLQNDQRSLRTGLVKERGIITSAYLTLRPDSYVDPRFLAYALHSLDIAKAFYALGGGLRQSMGMEEVGGLRIETPPLEEQRRIADFLDDQVARIDDAASLRHRQLDETALLERSLISSGVAGALDEAKSIATSVPNVPRIHREGELRTVGRLYTLQRGVDLTEDEREPGDVPVYTTAGHVGFHSRSISSGPGVIIGRYGSVGSVHWEPGSFWPHNTTLYVKDFRGNDPRWVYYSLKAYPFDMLQARSAIPGVNRNDMMSDVAAWLPVSMQREAARELDSALIQLAAWRSVIHRHIDLLTECKRSLITAAVTGELDVTTARRGVPA
jgi:type I restriction enzyme S subunit